jgi:hypothetical protein
LISIQVFGHVIIQSSKGPKLAPRCKLEKKYNVSIAFQEINYNQYMSTRKHRPITTVQYYLPVGVMTCFSWKGR